MLFVVLVICLSVSGVSDVTRARADPMAYRVQRHAHRNDGWKRGRAAPLPAGKYVK